MAKFYLNLLQAIRPDARRLRSLDFVDRQIHIPLVPDALFPLTLSLTLILLVCFSLLGRTWLASLRHRLGPPIYSFHALLFWYFLLELACYAMVRQIGCVPS